MGCLRYACKHRRQTTVSRRKLLRLNTTTIARRALPLKFHYAVVNVRAVQVQRLAHPGSAPGGFYVEKAVPQQPLRRVEEDKAFRLVQRDKKYLITHSEPRKPSTKLFFTMLWEETNEENLRQEHVKRAKAEMEDSGFEPLTYCVQSSRSPN